MHSMGMCSLSIKNLILKLVCNNSWPNSVQGNPYMRENFELWERIQKMNNDQLLEYYSSQDYLNKYGENKK